MDGELDKLLAKGYSLIPRCHAGSIYGVRYVANWLGDKRSGRQENMCYSSVGPLEGLEEVKDFCGSV